MKKYLIILLAVLFISTLVWAADVTYQAKVYHKAGGDEQVVANGGVITIESGGKITEESGGAVLGRAVLTAYAADVGIAGSYWVVSPFAGTIVNMAAVNYVANTTTKTVLTAEIAGTLVTAPAWEIAVTAAAGTVTAVVPTATNTVMAGQAIELISDGGSATANEAVMFSITILRTS